MAHFVLSPDATNLRHGPTLHDTLTQRNNPCDDHLCPQLEEDSDESDGDHMRAAAAARTMTSSYLPNPPAQEADMRQQEVKRDTQLQLKILLDGKNKGAFPRLQTSIKVC
jgi:hypothetical protein